MAESDNFEFESYQDTQTIQEYLQSLVDGFSSGQISLNSERDNIILHPRGLVQLTIRARKKGDDNRLSVKMSWKDSKVEQVGSLSITT